MIAAHLAIAASRCVFKPTDVILSALGTSELRSVSCCLTIGSSMATRSAALIFSSTGAGVPFGGVHAVPSLDLKPRHAPLGQRRHTGQRAQPVLGGHAIDLDPAVLDHGTVWVVWSHGRSTCPTSSVFIAGPVPE